jgi:hypothetical protein
MHVKLDVAEMWKIYERWMPYSVSFYDIQPAYKYIGRNKDIDDKNVY